MKDKTKKSGLFDVFYLFCDENSERITMRNPFVVGDKTYATDGYMMIWCDNDKIDFEFKNEGEPFNVAKVIPVFNVSEIIDIGAIDWLSLMAEDEKTTIYTFTKKCGHCGGSRRLEDSFLYNGLYYRYQFNCPVCNEDGYEETTKQIKTGNKTFGDNDIVKLKGAYFYASMFYTLKKVKDVIGGDVELVSYTLPINAVVFRIGIIGIMLMPCTEYNEGNIIASFE